MQQEQQVEKGNLRKNKEVKAYSPQVPFPQRLQKAKLAEQFSRFLNMFKKIEINVPFFEALTQMPHYAKFMKDILSINRKIDEEGVVILMQLSRSLYHRKCRIQEASLYLAKLGILIWEKHYVILDSTST